MKAVQPFFLLFSFLGVIALDGYGQGLPRTNPPRIEVHFFEDRYSVTGHVHSSNDRDLVAEELRKYLRGKPVQIKLQTNLFDKDLWSNWKADFKQSLGNALDRKSGMITIMQNVARSADDLARLLRSSQVELVQDCTNAALIDENKKTTLVVLFATWCGPCLKQLSAVNDLYKTFSRSGLEVVGLQSDNETRGDVLAMIEELRISYRVATPDQNVIDNILAFSEFAGIPQAILFSNGRVIHIFRGASDAETTKIKKSVEAALSVR